MPTPTTDPLDEGLVKRGPAGLIGSTAPIRPALPVIATVGGAAAVVDLAHHVAGLAGYAGSMAESEVMSLSALGVGYGVLSVVGRRYTMPERQNTVAGSMRRVGIAGTRAGGVMAGLGAAGAVADLATNAHAVPPQLAATAVVVGGTWVAMGSLARGAARLSRGHQARHNTSGLGE